MHVPLGDGNMVPRRAEDAKNPYDISLCIVEAGEAWYR